MLVREREGNFGGGGDIGAEEWGKCRKYMLQCIGEWKVQKGGIAGNILLNTHITYFFR
jgi:hypothetical protein